MKFSRAEDLKKALLPVFLMHWLFGFGIVEFPVGRPRKLFSVCWSVIQFFICLSILIVSEMSSLTNIRGSALTSKNYKIYIYTNFCLLVTCLVIGHVKAKSLYKCEQISIQMNTNLIRLGIPSDYDLLFKSQLLELSATLIFISIVTTINYLCLNYDYTSTINRIAFQLVMHYFGFVTFITDFSFRISVRYFKNRFRHLNMYLVKSSQQLKSDRDIQHFNADVLTNSIVAFEYSRDLRLLKATEGQWMARVVREVRNIHREICQSVNLLTDVYAFQMLIFFVINFILVTMLSYIVYVAFSSSEIDLSDQLSNDPFLIFLIVWIILYSGRMFIIIHTCSTTSSEARKTGKLIYWLSNQVTDQRVRDETRTFSLQLLQNPLAFEICGFFNLDYAFFRGVISSVTTFLVILIQMRNMGG